MPNAAHRAEVMKLMTAPAFRRQGYGRSLMSALEGQALKLARTLLVLDTREGDPSTMLYESLGYLRAGVIPAYARSATGQLHPTVFYDKQLD